MPKIVIILKFMCKINFMLGGDENEKSFISLGSGTRHELCKFEQSCTDILHLYTNQ